MNVLRMEATDAISAPTKKCAKKKKSKNTFPLRLQISIQVARSRTCAASLRQSTQFAKIYDNEK